jgi:hypothetical protein
METMSVDEKGKPIVKNVLLPTEYIGTWAEKSGAAPKRAGSERPGRPAGATPTRQVTAAPARGQANGQEAEEEEEGEAPAIPAALRKKITPKAQSSTTKEFLKSMAKDPDVMALPDDVMSYVLASGPNGFWASVQPE